jgi:ATP synthase protein I
LEADKYKLSSTERCAGKYNAMTQNSNLKKHVERQVKRIKKSEREQYSWLAQTTYIGTLGLVFVLPVLLGAYLGRWLDENLAGYSVHWTLSLLLIGVFIGAMNIYFLIRK